MEGIKFTIRVSDSIARGVEEYIKKHPEFFDKSTAVRTLIIKGLEADGIKVGEADESR